LSFAPDVVKHVVRRIFWPHRLTGKLPVSQAYQGIADIAFSGSKGERPAPKPMSKPSGRTVSPSLALSGTPAVPLWNSIGLFISATAFGFWDLCGIEFCILKVLPTGFTSNSGCFLPQRAAQKLRRINKEISAMTKKQQADLDDSQPAERRCLFYVLPFSSNACSFTRECNADFYNWRNIHCLQINAVCTVVDLLQGNISKVFKLCFRAVFSSL